MRNIIKEFKRIVIKVGTKSLLDSEGNISEEKIYKLVKQICDLYSKGKEVILVTSGAIVTGLKVLKIDEAKNLRLKQAVASIGQIELMAIYKKYFDNYGIKIGQVLLTEDDLKNRERYLNARNTFLTLIEDLKVVPIVNENDVVGIEEIIFGDNDVLSSLVANLIDAQILIILSNVEGFIYEGKVLKEVKKITSQIESYANDAIDEYGKGGMKSKIKAAKICVQAGISVVIAKSDIDNILIKIMNGEEYGTFFYPLEKKISHRKRWIAYSVVPKGKLIIDNGAKNALVNDFKSLLPAGILKVEGEFKKGDIVEILDESYNLIGKGLVNFDNKTIEIIKGKKSNYIKEILGEKFYTEVIHRDNLVILGGN